LVLVSLVIRLNRILESLEVLETPDVQLVLGILEGLDFHQN
jgi:hypothetical protein